MLKFETFLAYLPTKSNARKFFIFNEKMSARSFFAPFFRFYCITIYLRIFRVKFFLANFPSKSNAMNFYTMKKNIGIFRSVLPLQTIFAFRFILFKSTYFFRKRQKCLVFTHFPSKSNEMNFHVFKEIYICRSRHKAV